MKHYLCIDPGASGAFALGEGDNTSIFKMMPESEIRDYIESLATAAHMEGHALVAVVEEVGGFIGKPTPGSAMFNFGSGYGFVRGLLAAYRVETRLVRPQVWQKGIPGVMKTKGPERKRALKEHAARLYPHFKVTLANCDALLLLDWARRSLP